MSITVVLMQMIKLFLIMCIGFVLYKIKIIDNHTRGQLTKIILYVTTPALIVNSFIDNMESDNTGNIEGLFVIAVILYLLLPIVGIIFNLILRIKEPKKQGMYLFMTVFSNVGFMGFPVADALYGSEGVFYAAVFNCIFNISVFTMGVFFMNIGKEDRGSISSLFSIKKILNPGILCCIIAIVIFIFRIPVPNVVNEVLASVGGLTSTLAMLLVGVSLATMNLKEMLGDIRVYVYTVIRQVALPLAAWPIISRFISNELAAAITLIMVAMPVGNMSVLFAMEYDGDEKTAAKGVFLTTLASMVSIPFVMWVCL